MSDPRTQNHHATPVEGVPACLRERAQWVVWRSEQREPGKKPTKVPYAALGGTRASAVDRGSWCSFDDAHRVWRAGGYDGIGFVFSRDDPFCGVDLDDCIDTATGVLKPWGRRIIEALNSYAEISPSGGGVKVIVRATKPGPRCKTKYEDGALEMYDCDRYFTITGRPPGAGTGAAPAAGPGVAPGAGAGPGVEPRQEAINQLYASAFPQESVRVQLGLIHEGRRGEPDGVDDETILELASRGSNGAKFSSLWAGMWEGRFGSQSEADSSVVFTLAFYTKDAAQIDRLFRRSALMRPKWDERRGEQTYGQMTIRNALANVTGQYRPQRSASCHPHPASIRDDAGEIELDEQGLTPLGSRDPASGRLVLSPKRTLPTATAFVDAFYTHAHSRTLHFHAGAFLVWSNNRYLPLEDAAITQQLLPWLHQAWRYQFNKHTKRLELVPFDANPTTVHAALESIRTYTHVPTAMAPPCWLGDASNRPDPRNLLPCLSGTLDLSTGRSMPPTPALINTNALDFDPPTPGVSPAPGVPSAPGISPAPGLGPPSSAPGHFPGRWIAFLRQLWDDDTESIQLLQEWMGYSLVADTSLQKMLLLVGPKRSGKGTIGRVLARLVGAGNVVGPTTASLGGTFGLQSLIGKSLAIVSDARFAGDNVGVVVERLLCISGEDTLTIDRKFLGSVTMKLPTRFLFLTNELPRMTDASAALAGRFVILRLSKSFYGEENPDLTRLLLGELPSILAWAIDGLKRLRQRGRFVQPGAGASAIEEMEDLASPVLAFVRDCCHVGAGHRTWIDDLYTAWARWCEGEGRRATSKQVLGRDLAAAVPGLTCRRHSAQGRFYEGIALRVGGAR